MAGFLYFVPGLSVGASDSDLAAKGLDYALLGDGEQRHGSGVRGGPGGENGVVLGLRHSVKTQHLGYFPDRQKWEKAPGGEYWVGYDPSQPPTPRDVQRANVTKGKHLQLNDGHQWCIPVAQLVKETGDQFYMSCALPQKISLNNEGRWTQGGVEPRFCHLWTTASGWWDIRMGQQIVGENAVMETDHDVIEAAVTVLSANYRVKSIEVAMLDLLNERTVLKVLDAASAYDDAMEWVKKNLKTEPSE